MAELQGTGEDEEVRVEREEPMSSGTVTFLSADDRKLSPRVRTTSLSGEYIHSYDALS